MQTLCSYVNEYFQKNEQILLNNYPGLREPRLLEEYCAYTQCNKNDSYTGGGEEFWKSIEVAKPLEYIQNNAYFFRSNFYVNEDVLIPRTETEILVEKCLEYINTSQKEELTIVEIGVGSGCIGLSILIDSKKKINFWGGDISTTALDVAKVNHFRLKNKIDNSDSIEFVESDRLKNCHHSQVDLIVSNPPYISYETHQEAVHHQAKKFEPHVALFLSASEYFKWFETLFHDVAAILVEEGIFLMEGHEDQLERLADLAGQEFKKVEIKKDYTGRLRFLICYR